MKTCLNEMPIKESLAETILRNGIAGQHAILEDHLRNGVSLIYQNEDGRLVKKNPDGSVEYTTYEACLSD